ncbi:MAG: GH3 auxin-responsive promoter family protein [Candidatus Accumulibacter sp.]|jgi:hypothetical protein|nr:GH3 auxin-responsive promoter family protein [Accumulibacter sp.]
MNENPWDALDGIEAAGEQRGWLSKTLARNRGAAYLKRFGAPRTLAAFRRDVPVVSYDDLLPWLERMKAGESDLLFAGRPVAYERTGGSAGGVKLIPYSRAGLLDFQRDVAPWLARTARRYRLAGRAYFSISPASRPPESIGGVPLGLPDTAYLGERAGRVLAACTAVPLEIGAIADLAKWRRQTLAHLKAANDLELISVWSPTFLLRLLEEIPDPQACWPRLKVVSCWASGTARRFADELRERLPRADLQAKGLMSTEAVVSVPGDDGKALPARHVFVEYAGEGRLFLEEELRPGDEYEAVVTTASGLYRYRTGDRVRCEGRDREGRAILEFIGRDGLTCDLVGEKLTEAFVSRCLRSIPGFSMLLPDLARPGYALIHRGTGIAGGPPARAVEEALCANPQYAYARRLGQLAPLRAVAHPDPFALVERRMLERGARLGDVKPLALRREAFWLPLFESARR